MKKCLEYAGAFLQLYREEGWYLERTVHYLARVGLEHRSRRCWKMRRIRKACTSGCCSRSKANPIRGTNRKSDGRYPSVRTVIGVAALVQCQRRQRRQRCQRSNSRNFIKVMYVQPMKVICSVTDIPVLGSRVVQRAHKPNVAIFRNSEDKIFALLDRCPQQRWSLIQGIVFWRTRRLPAA